MGLFLVTLSCLVFFAPVTMIKADKLDGKLDHTFTKEQYFEALKPITTANHNKYN